MSKTILIDMDDTIENLSIEWVKYINRLYGTDVDPYSLRDFNVSLAFPTLTYEQVYGITLEEELWKYVRPIDGAVHYVKKLIDDGHRVYIVTSTEYESIRYKMEHVLFKYFPYLTWKDVIITANKQLIKGDVLVDDGIHNLVGGDYEKILFTAPHNCEYDAEANGMTRVNTWAEVYETINTL